MTRMMGGLLATAIVGAAAAGCATGTVYTKKGADRESVAIDVLDCNKAAIVAYRATRKRYSDPDSPVARQKAAAAGNAALRRCLVAHGWKKKAG